MAKSYGSGVGNIVFGILMAAASAGAPGALRADDTSDVRGVNLNIAAQPLSDALADFAQQTGLQIVVSSSTTGTLQAPRISGRYTPEAALGALLAQSGLRYKFMGDSVVGVMPQRANDAIPASPVSPATSARWPETKLRDPMQLRLASRADDAGMQAGVSGDDSSETSSDVEDVIVTAQKFAQNIIDVPISISVVDSEELAALRVQGVEDYALSIPNVTYQKAARDVGPQIFIRGISGDTGGNFSPINVTLDEIPLVMVTSSVLLQMRSFDLERIEVLRGPQGTLTGANALGGIVSLVSAKADPTAFAAKATVDVGRYDAMFVQGVLNMPLSETFAVRAVAYRESSDGATVNIGPSGGSSSTDNFGARLAARWAPNDAWATDVSFTHESQDYGQNERAYIDRYDDAPNATSPRRAFLINLMNNAGGVYFDNKIPFWNQGADNNKAYISLDFPENDQFDYDIATFQTTYDAGAHRFALLGGHYEFQGYSTWDADRTEQTFFAADVKRKVKADSIELRASSAYEGPLNWVAGLAWHDEDMPFGEVGYASPWVLIASGDLDPNDVVGDPHNYSLTDYAFHSSSKIETKAIFGSLFYDITDRLHLSAGLRFTKVDARFGSQCCGDDFASPLDNRNHDALIAGLDPIELGDGSSEEFNPRLTLNFDLTEKSSAYFQYGTGFRPGTGNDPRVVAAGEAADTADPEYVKNYELGIKGRYLDNRLSFGAAAFYMDYTDMQVNRTAEVPIGEAIEGTLFLSYTANAGKSSVKGFEVESSFNITNEFQLRASVGYADSSVKEFDDVTYSPSLNTPGIRPWNANLSGIYSKPMENGLTANFRADYRWQDKAWDALFVEEKTPGNYLPGWKTLDLTAGVSSSKWAAMAYIENALNERYFLGETNWSNRPSVFFIPRTFGLRLTYNFAD